MSIKSGQPHVVLSDGAEGLEHMGHSCLAGCLPIVDFYHALDHAGDVLGVLLGSKTHPDYPARQGRRDKQFLKNGVEKLIVQTRQEADVWMPSGNTDSTNAPPAMTP